MNLRHLLGTIVLLVIVGAAATVTGTAPPRSNVLNLVARSPVTTSSISFSRADVAEADHEDLLPPQTTTTLAPSASTVPTVPAENSIPEGSQTTTTTQPAATTTVDDGGFNAGFEAAFFAKVNTVRATQGLPALKRNSSLDGEARDWAKSMATAGVLSHSALGRLIPPWSAVAENVGNGPSVSSIFAALSSSSGHLENMLGDYTDCGVGVWVDANGILWTAQVFTK